MRHALKASVAALCLVLIGLGAVVASEVETDRHTVDADRRAHTPSGDLGHVGTPKDEDDFRRFRIGAVDGARLTPNTTDFAARSQADAPLLLFLPATRAKPADYQLFLSTALSDGYHVLGLDYWNLGTTLSGTCETDAHCYTEVQRNRFDGSDASHFSTVTPAGSITARFRDSIAHLAQVDPNGGWSRFVEADGDIDWGAIVIAGHSQGGGEAAYIAHVRPVLGALMFSSPVESDGPFHAAWMDHPGRTSVDRMYALDDVRDVFGPRIRGSWRVLGLDGPDGRPWRTDTAAPSGDADPHAILTAIDVGDPGRSHSRIIDDATPLDGSGTPRMLPLWEWMLHRFPLPETHQSATTAPTATATTAPTTTSPATTAPTTTPAPDDAAPATPTRSSTRS